MEEGIVYNPRGTIHSDEHLAAVELQREPTDALWGDFDPDPFGFRVVVVAHRSKIRGARERRRWVAAPARIAFAREHLSRQYAKGIVAWTAWASWRATVRIEGVGVHGLGKVQGLRT